MAHPLLAGAEPVQELLDRLVAREKLPGAVLLVSGPAGRVVATAGLANLKTREPVTPQTRFYIASSGKLVTAVATLQLVQEGKLKLNDPVLLAEKCCRHHRPAKH
jgi:D-alanyl-D-alanine carboxypeptidase